MKKHSLFFALLLLVQVACLAQTNGRWSEEKAKAWYAQQPWFVGANFVPSTAINQLEMWQVESFDTATISRELGYAQSIGMNCMRVFLHDLLYQQNPKGFLQRINTFLSIADRHNIRIMFVFFDSVWDPYPYLGKQRDPLPGVHNSGWVQSPGVHALRDSTQDARLEKYVKAVVKQFGKDRRVFCWDVWNEPDNMNGYPYSGYEPKNKADLVLRIMRKAFQWVRSQNPVQPLTTYVMAANAADVNNIQNPALKEMVQLVLDQSDIISFHNYDGPDRFTQIARQYARHGRPMICTEFMARGNGSTFQAILPLAKQMNIGILCWGLVAGKSNTIHDWGTWQHPDKGEPKTWHHDVFRKNGEPFSKEEVNVIRDLTGKKAL